MKKITAVVVILLLALFVPGIAPAAPVTKQLPYTKSVALGSGSYTFRFSLWTAESGGTQVWFEDQTLVLGKAVINTFLGKVTALSGVDFSQQLWVQVEQGGAALEPRDILTVAPYALWSDSGTDATKVAKTGDSMTGTLNLPANGLAVGTNQLIASGGNVGIGTTAPSVTLDVNGAIRAGNYKAGPASMNAYSMEIGGSAPSQTSGQATIYLHHHNKIAHQLRYSEGTLFLEGTRNGYGTSDTPNLTVGGRVTAGGIYNTSARTYLSGMDDAGYHWIMVGGVTEGRQNALGFHNNSFFAGPGWTKNFLTHHPLDPENKYLSHATLEGPENAVFYRGEGRLENGSQVIALPDYFEGLTRKEGRTVLLTPIFEDEAPVSMLAASEVSNGAFRVKSIDAKNLSQRFYWEVKAVRADVDILETEFPKAQADRSASAPR